MALSDVILPRGKIIVILSDSVYGLAATGEQALNFGSVQKVNQLTDAVTVGQIVLFDVTKATPFYIVSGVKFYMVDEDDISLTETPPP